MLQDENVSARGQIKLLVNHGIVWTTLAQRLNGKTLLSELFTVISLFLVFEPKSWTVTNLVI